MTTFNRTALAAVLLAALPGLALAQGLGGMQVETTEDSRYVLSGSDGANPTVPHRPETDIHFPRR